jgi:hypothetical protein
LAAYDLWFHDNERDELVKQLGIAGFQLGHGRMLDCHRFLDGYWPRFLEEFVPGDPPAVEFTGTTAPPGSVPPGSVPPGSVPAGSVPAGSMPAATAPLPGGNTTGRPGDRGLRPPAASLRRNGSVRPRIGPDSPPGVPDARNRPAPVFPPVKSSAQNTPAAAPVVTAPGTAAPVVTAPGTAAPIVVANPFSDLEDEPLDVRPAPGMSPPGTSTTGTTPARTSAPARLTPATATPSGTVPSGTLPSAAAPSGASAAARAGTTASTGGANGQGAKSGRGPGGPPSAERPAPGASDKPAAQTTWRDRLESFLPKRFW